MDDASHNELDQLIKKRVDPRRGVSLALGTVRWALGIMMIVGYIVYLVTPISAKPYGLGFTVLFGIGSFVIWLIPIEIRRATKKRAKRHGNFLCPWCRYALTSLPDEGICPECGARYRRAVCETLYQCAYREFQPSGNEVHDREKKAWTEAIELRDQDVEGATS